MTDFLDAHVGLFWQILFTFHSLPIQLNRTSCSCHHWKSRAFFRVAIHLLYKHSLQLKLSSTAKASNLLSCNDFLSKLLTVLTEAKFASPENMIQGVVTNSNSHVSPVTYSSEHWDGIVLFTAVTVNINSFQILKIWKGNVMACGGIVWDYVCS